MHIKLLGTNMVSQEWHFYSDCTTYPSAEIPVQHYVMNIKKVIKSLCIGYNDNSQIYKLSYIYTQ